MAIDLFVSLSFTNWSKSGAIVVDLEFVILIVLITSLQF
jgi:hypothetical protein